MSFPNVHFCDMNVCRNVLLNSYHCLDCYRNGIAIRAFNSCYVGHINHTPRDGKNTNGTTYCTRSQNMCSVRVGRLRSGGTGSSFVPSYSYLSSCRGVVSRSCVSSRASARECVCVCTCGCVRLDTNVPLKLLFIHRAHHPAHNSWLPTPGDGEKKTASTNDARMRPIALRVEVEIRARYRAHYFVFFSSSIYCAFYHCAFFHSMLPFQLDITLLRGYL